MQLVSKKLSECLKKFKSKHNQFLFLCFSFCAAQITFHLKSESKADKNGCIEYTAGATCDLGPDPRGIVSLVSKEIFLESFELFFSQ